MKKQLKFKGWMVSGSRNKSGKFFNKYRDAMEEMHRQMFKGSKESGISEVWDFEKSLTKTSRHMTKMKKKYGNRKFKKEELFGYD